MLKCQAVSVSLDRQLIDDIDAYAKRHGIRRSTVFVRAITRVLSEDPVWKEELVQRQLKAVGEDE
jgi:metal-responsive CopG/Arc/MetJ family transcriptional regulator